MSIGRWIRLAGPLVAVAACSGGYTSGDSNNNGNDQNPPANPGGTPQASASVSVNNNFFSPNSVLLAAGGTVTWNWVGNGHSVTPNGTPAFSPDAPVSDAPHTLVVTFPSTGDYRYFCTVHGVSGGYSSGMVGTIFVR